MTDQAPTEQPTKPAIQSTTFQGIALVIVGQLVSIALAHYKITIPGLSDEISNDIVSYGISGIGLVVAGIGRIFATHKIAGIITSPAK